MAELHEALKTLAPIDWRDVPINDASTYVKELVQASELICNSVPSPVDGTTAAEEESTQLPKASVAQTATDTLSNAQAPPPHEEHAVLQSGWGKPIKFSAKDNPLQVAVYKMAGKDRHGAWFARRSVHEGIGFNKFKTAMLREFPQTLTVKGGPGAGSIRGIGGDERLERINVDETGKLEVMQLSAQFPGPTTPREFITLLITDHSPAKYSSSQQGRQLMVISKPVNHPNAPERSGYIRGQYESVELIREIPVNRSASKSSPQLPSTSEESAREIKLKRSKTDGQNVPLTQDAADDDAESNPVEWIMITRSDPGGGIPRFMVDRGTPSTMLGDVTKFLDWAVKVDEHEDPNVDSLTNKDTAAKEVAEADPDAAPPQYTDNEVTTSKTVEAHEGGVFQQLTTALEASLDAYAPAMVSSFVHERLHRRQSISSSSVSSDLSTVGSFASAADTSQALGVHADAKSLNSDSTSIQSDMTKPRDKHHDKEMQKIKEAKAKLTDRLAKKREEESEKLKKSQDDENSEAAKALEKHNKEIKKQEERHQKEMDKLEARREREMKKFEDKKRKQNDRDATQKLTRERDEFRDQVDLLKKENALLRERIESLESPGTNT